MNFSGETEYATTQGLAYDCSRVDAPKPPSGDGWELVNTAAVSESFQVIRLFWTWKRVSQDQNSAYDP